MIKILLFFLMLPAASFCQCPSWLGESPRQVESLMSLMEQRLSFKFSDTSTAPANDRLVYNSSDGRFVLKLELINGLVQSLNLEAPTSQVQMFNDWLEATFEECITSKNGQATLYQNFGVLTNPLSASRSYFYMTLNDQKAK